jgi:hypothetical protein
MADLLSLDEAREQFARTEPLAQVTFATLGGESRAAPVISYDKGWAKLAGGEEKVTPTRPVGAWLTVPQLGKTFQLTYQAAQQLGSTCRIPQDYQISVPPDLLAEHVNWWLAEGLGERLLKLLLAGAGEDEAGTKVPLAVAQTRATVTPFSNLELLDRVLAVVAGWFGKEAAARAAIHFTMYHDLEHTDFRVVLAGEGREVPGSALDSDVWLPAVEVSNSCIGLKQTTVTGGLVREATNAVALDAANSAGGFKRLRSTPEEAFEWAAEAAGDVLGALDIAYANLADIAQRPVGDALGTFVGSLCNEFRVPRAQAERVSAVLEEFPGDLTMYELAAAVARTANMDGLAWRARGQLMTMAGHVVHAQGGRCTKDRPCCRALPQNFEPPEGSG